MKTRIFLCFLLLPLFVFAKDPSLRLTHYLKVKDYFRLRSEFKLTANLLSDADRLYFRAFIDNAFNRCAESSSAVNELLAKKDLRDSVTVKLLQLQIDNQVKLYDYAAAAVTSDQLINVHGNSLDTAELTDVKNSAILWKALSKVGPQQIGRRMNTSIPWKRDTAGLMNIPVSIGGVLNDFVFDTGANLSMMSASYAKELHLQLIETSFDLGSSTSITNKATLAVASSLLIGNVELKNVVFMVLPDDKLSFPQIHYKINAIIGYPVISELGEVTIRQNGTMQIPEKIKKSDLHNLAMNGLLPVIAVETGRDTLSYSFDTGAKQSMFFKPYFDKYRNEVIQNGKPDSVNLGGAGGSVRYKSYRLPVVSLRPNERSVQLINIDVLTSPLSDNGDNYDGTIGQDLIAKFEEMTLNFKEMYIDFK